jgi:hypothetical protein
VWFFAAGFKTSTHPDIAGRDTQAHACTELRIHDGHVTLFFVQVIALVQRCVSAPVAPAVKSTAEHMLQRWKWQLAGHMQVRAEALHVALHYVGSYCR